MLCHVWNQIHATRIRRDGNLGRKMQQNIKSYFITFQFQGCSGSVSRALRFGVPEDEAKAPPVMRMRPDAKLSYAVVYK